MTRLPRLTLLTATLCACGPTLKPFPPSTGTIQSATQWTTVVAPHVNYYGVSGSAANDVVLVGSQGTILRWNGVKLSQEKSNTTVNLRGVYCVSPKQAYAVGDLGTVLVWNGTTWTAAPQLFSVTLSAVWSDGTRVFAVGQGGAAVGYLNNNWVLVPTDSSDNLFGVSGGAGQVIAVGTLGTVTSYTAGVGFTRAALPGFAKTLGAVNIGPSGTFLAGLEGGLFSDNNGVFTQISGLPSTFIRSLADVGGGTIFAIGWFGSITRIRANGEQLTYPAPANSWFYGAHAAGGQVWVVGTNGAVLRGPPSVDPPPGATGPFQVQSGGGP